MSAASAPNMSLFVQLFDYDKKRVMKNALKFWSNHIHIMGEIHDTDIQLYISKSNILSAHTDPQKVQLCRLAKPNLKL